MMTNQRSYSLSLAQEKLWLFQQIHSGTTAYHLPITFRLRGNLDIPVLRRSIMAVVRRHESLRTTFPLEKDVPIQVVHKACNVSFAVEDLTDTASTALQQRIREELAIPFDLSKGPLFRIRVFKLAPDLHVLLLMLHHIIADGWSVSILCSEISQLYSAYLEKRPGKLPKLKMGYGSFAERQRKRFTAEVIAGELDFWKGELESVPMMLELPTDHPRPTVATHRGAVEDLLLPRDVSMGIKTAGVQLRSTPYAILLAGLCILLCRYSGQSDVVIASPMAGRKHVDHEKIIGEFANTVPLRADLSDNPIFQSLVAQVRRRVLMAYSHQEIPFNELVSSFKLPRSLSYYPLAQVIFALQNTPRSLLALPGVHAEEAGLEWKTSRVDFSIMLEDTGSEYAGKIEYSTDLFKAATMRRLAGHYICLLRAAIADPSKRVSDYPVLTPDERDQLLVTWNATATPVPGEQCVHEIFQQQVQQAPHHMAAASENRSWSYAELDSRANQFGNFLREQGVRPETRVVVQVERSLDWLALMLGIMKAGGIYVPVDTKVPPARTAFIVEDARAELVITDSNSNSPWPQGTRVMHSGHINTMIQNYAATTPESRVVSQNVAYIIYTSGSTGRPKGVAVEHRSVAHLKKAQDRLGVGTADRVLQFASPGFDASVFEIVLALLRGATLVLRPPQPVAGPLLTEILEREQISAAVLPPSIVALAPPRPLPVLHTVMIAGEVAAPEVYANWSPNRRFWNLYGPTETTVWATATDAATAQCPSNIGKPVSNIQTYVLDSALQPLPTGIAGELYISGAGLARGYWNRPELTAASFLPNPFTHEPGTRMYRTGDRVRWRADGTLEFLGRIDHQIKLRGFRIELGEIESVLQEHPAVQVCAVINDSKDPHQLAAFVVARGNSEGVSDSGLRAYLNTRLPDFMVPAIFITVPSLPLNTSGKVDRKALAEIQISRPSFGGGNPLQGSTEEIITGIWQQLLSRNDLKPDQNFFEAGGNSLLIVRMYDALRASFGPVLSMADLFQYPTIASLSGYLKERTRPATVPPSTNSQTTATNLLHDLRSRQAG
jgi:amino acid adenylation domain-containing protein